MAKPFNLTDNTPLYDGKILLLAVDDVPGVTQSTIIRTYDGNTDSARHFRRIGGDELSNEDFQAGDVLFIQYNVATLSYYLLDVKSNHASTSKTVTNGFAQAGYIVDSNGDSTDNTENFEIPTGLRVGFGGNGSSEFILSKGGLVTGQADSKVKLFQIPTAFPWAGGSTVLGDTLNDRFHGGFFGFGSELQPYKKSGAPGSDPEYVHESSVVGNQIVFDGQYTILGGSTQSELDIGDIRLIDLIDDDLVTVVGRYRAELVDNGGNWNWKVLGNIQEAIVSTNYTAGVLNNSFANSFSIGNKAYITADNQIVLGTTGGTGEIITDYALSVGSGGFHNFDAATRAGYTPVYDTTSMGIEGDVKFNAVEGNNGDIMFSAVADETYIGDQAGPAGFYVRKNGVTLELNATVPFYNRSISAVPLRVHAITGTTADFFQLFDDGSKIMHVNNSAELVLDPAVHLDAQGTAVLGVVNNGGDQPWLDMGHANQSTRIGWNDDVIATFTDAEMIMGANTQASLKKTLIQNDQPSQVTCTIQSPASATEDILQVKEEGGEIVVNIDEEGHMTVQQPTGALGNILTVNTESGQILQINNAGNVLLTVPSSSAGLPSKALWDNSGSIERVP